MRRNIRASALAVAAFSLFASASFAEPTAIATPASSYAEHASVTVPLVEMGMDLAEEAGEQGSAQTPAISDAPVIGHAMAPAFAEDEGLELSEDERNGRSLSQLVADYAGVETPDEETECLARAVYYESKGESLSGQLSVADVIINRARSGRFASTLCGVVRQRGQFSFVRGGEIPTPPRASRDWRTAVAIAQIATRDLADGAAPQALFFHARHVNPNWRHTRVATVGNHVFYR